MPFILSLSPGSISNLVRMQFCIMISGSHDVAGQVGHVGRKSWTFNICDVLVFHDRYLGTFEMFNLAFTY